MSSPLDANVRFHLVTLNYTAGRIEQIYNSLMRSISRNQTEDSEETGEIDPAPLQGSRSGRVDLSPGPA